VPLLGVGLQLRGCVAVHASEARHVVGIGQLLRCPTAVTIALASAGALDLIGRTGRDA
jgi:hypothetical protein